MAGPWYIGQRKKVRGPFSLNYKHTFSMEHLYKRLHAWLVDEGYGGDDKWMEKLYLERMLAPGVKQIWIWWRPTKGSDNNFFKFDLEIDFHALGLTQKEIVHEGEKFKINAGEIEVFITAHMWVDPKKTWNKHWLMKYKYLQDYFLNKIYRHKIEEEEEKFVKDITRLLGAIKQYYQLDSYLKEYQEEPFQPRKGLYEK